MSRAYQFPQDEPNPFADPAKSGESADEMNPYAAGDTGERPPLPHDAYAETLPARGGKLVALALPGLLVGLLSLVLFWWLGLVGIIGLCFSLPAWIMAQHDRKAMKYGAMNPATRGTVQLAWIMAIAGTLINIGAVALMIAICAGIPLLFM